MKTSLSMSSLLSLSFLAACSTSKTLVVNSGPSEAKVYMKGFNKDYFPTEKFEVGTTPLKLEKYRYTDDNGKLREVDINDVDGEHFYLILEKDNYETKSVAAPPWVHQINLAPAPGAAVARKILEADEKVMNTTMRITSHPTGAKVYIDNHLVGNSPYNADLKEGHYDIKISHPEYEGVAEKVVIDKSAPRALHFDLLKAPSKVTMVEEQGSH